jgi:hypothetical protein
MNSTGPIEQAAATSAVAMRAPRAMRNLGRVRLLTRKGLDCRLIEAIRRKPSNLISGQPASGIGSLGHQLASAEMRPLTDMAERVSAGVFGHVLRLLGCKIG